MGQNIASTRHWIKQRISSILLIPLTLLFFYNFLNISSPKISDIKKPINIISVIDKAIPVILCNIESTEFSWGLYIVK